MGLATPPVWGSSIACSIGLCLLVTAIVWPPPARVPRQRLVHLAAVIFCGGSVSVAAAAVLHAPLLALTLGGFVLAAAAVLITSVRAIHRDRRDDGDGGGGFGWDDDPPRPDGPPGGDGAEWDWAAFEQQAHAAYRDSRDQQLV